MSACRSASRSRHPAPSSVAVVELPARMTTDGIRALHAELKTRLRTGKAPPRLIIDGTRVEEVDTAGLQLLLAMRRSADAAGSTIEWRSPSAALVRAARNLALTDALGWRDGA